MNDENKNKDKDGDENKDKKITNEKPVAIPLDFEDAVKMLLTVKPKDDKGKDESQLDKKKKEGKT